MEEADEGLLAVNGAIHNFVSSSCTSGKKGTGAGRGCEKPIIQPRGLRTGWSVDLQSNAHGCPGKHGRQLWVRCGGGGNTRGGQPHRTFILRGREPILVLRWTSYLQMAHRMKCWAPRGTDQRNHPGTGRDVRCVRSKSQVKSSHLYLYSAFNNTNCNKALHNIKIGKFCQCKMTGFNTQLSAE